MLFVLEMGLYNCGADYRWDSKEVSYLKSDVKAMEDVFMSAAWPSGTSRR